MKKIKLAAALIEINDKFLIAQQSHGDFIGKWDFPIFQISKNERIDKVIYKGILEKFNISIKCDKVINRIIYHDFNKSIELSLCHCTYLSGEVVSTYACYLYVDKKILSNYDLSPISQAILQNIKDY